MSGFIDGNIKAKYDSYSTMIGSTSGDGLLESVSPGTADQVLTSNGAGVAPTYQDLDGNQGLSGWTTFTPTIVGTSSAGVGTYSFRAASYALLGVTCYIKGAIVWTAHTGTGNPTIGGLPFQPYNTDAFEFQAMRVQSVNWGSNDPLNGLFRAFVADVLHLYAESGSASSFDTSATLWFSGFYQIDH